MLCVGGLKRIRQYMDCCFVARSFHIGFSGSGVDLAMTFVMFHPVAAIGMLAGNCASASPAKPTSAQAQLTFHLLARKLRPRDETVRIQGQHTQAWKVSD